MNYHNILNNIISLSDTASVFIICSTRSNIGEKRELEAIGYKLEQASKLWANDIAHNLSNDAAISVAQGKGKKHFYEHVSQAVNDAHNISLNLPLLGDANSALKETKETLIYYLNNHRQIISDIRHLDKPLTTLIQACGDLLDEASTHGS